MPPSISIFSDIKVRMQALDTERLPNGKEGPFFGNFTRFLFKFDTKYNDKRYEFLFKPKNFRTTDSFSQFLESLFGLKSGKSIVVLNLNNIPQEVINAIVSLLSRLVFDFNMWNPHRANLPILLCPRGGAQLPQSARGGTDCSPNCRESRKGRKKIRRELHGGQSAAY